jgi:cell division protein FtsB
MSRLMSFIKDSKDNFSRLLTSIFIILLLVILFSLQYRLWIGEGSLIEMFALQEKINQQEVKNNELIMQNQDLINQVNALKNGFDGVEARAREELGLIKSDETFFMVVDQPNSSK